MTKEEKLDKVCRDFCSLSEDKQEYVLGILQALAYAKDEIKTIIEPPNDKEEIKK